MIRHQPLFLFFILWLSSAALFAQKHPVAHIAIRGNRITQTFIIERELLFQPDSLYNLATIRSISELSRRQLINLNLFNKVEFSDSLAADGWHIQLYLTEKWYIWPIPFVEYADRNFTQWQDFRLNPDRTNYGFYFFWYNLRGRNETMKISLVDGYTRDLGLEYRIPWVDRDKKNGITASVHHRRNREIWSNTFRDHLQFYRDPVKDLFIRNEFLLSWQHRKAFFETHRLYAIHKRYRIDSVVMEQSLNSNFIGNGLKLFQSGLQYEWLIERRDNRFYPLVGHFFKASTGLYALDEGVANLRWMADGKVSTGYYLRLQEKLYAAGYAESLGRVINQGGIPYWLNRSFGYGQGVRGFERYVVDGNRYFIGKMSLKTPLMTTKYLNLPLLKQFRGLRNIPAAVYAGTFFDLGYVSQQPMVSMSNNLPNQWLSSAGFGIDFLFYWDKLMRVEISRNSLGDYGLFFNFRQAM